MTNKPVICFDLDGTLLDHEGRLHPADALVLQKAGSLPAQLVAATGRPLSSVKHSLADFGLFLHDGLPLPLILLNGAAIYASREQLLGYTPFGADNQQRLMEIAQQFEQVTFFFLSANRIYSLHDTLYGRQAAELYHFDTLPFTQEAGSEAFCKFMALSQDTALLGEVEAACQRLDLEQAYSMASIYEITPQGVNKGQGLRQLIDKLGWHGRRVLAAGDGENDLSLLEAADRSYAPVTSPEAIRAAADELVDREERGLLAHLLEAAEG